MFQFEFWILFDMLEFPRFFFLVHTYDPHTTFYLTQIQNPVLSKDSGKFVFLSAFDVRTASLKQ